MCASLYCQGAIMLLRKITSSYWNSFNNRYLTDYYFLTHIGGTIFHVMSICIGMTESIWNRDTYLLKNRPIKQYHEALFWYSEFHLVVREKCPVDKRVTDRTKKMCLRWNNSLISRLLWFPHRQFYLVM